MNIYYVYAYLRRKDGSPYYIGKGKGRRYKAKHRVSVPKNPFLIVFLETNLTELGALALERRYIRWYGRKDNGTGILHNQTDGGDGNGVSGELNPMFGKKHSEATRKKISEAGKGRTLSKEHIQQLKDRVITKAQRENLKQKNLGANNPRYNCTVSEATRKKISEAGKGRIQTKETKDAIRAAQLGIPKPRATCLCCKKEYPNTWISRHSLTCVSLS
jgi:hypothetical protein